MDNATNRRKSLGERMKERLKATNVKAVLRAVTISMVLLLVVIASAMQLVLDPARLTWNTWLATTGVMVAIYVVGIFLGESWGKDHQRTYSRGKYQYLLHQFRERVRKIDEARLFSSFDKWYAGFARKHERMVMEDYLLEFGVVDSDVVLDNLARFQERSVREGVLLHPVRMEDGRFVSTKTAEQLQAVDDILRGELNLRTPSSNFYLTEYMHQRLDILKAPEEINRRKRSAELFGRGARIASSVILSAFWAMVTVQDFMDAGNTQAWMDLLSRVVAVFTSIFNGYLNGVIYVGLDGDLLDNKTRVLDQFLNDVENGAFKPGTQQEEAREEYERYRREHPVAEVEVVQMGEDGNAMVVVPSQGKEE